MRRQYQIEDVKKHILTLKEKVPNLKIYTHMIVGFPGETDEDFQQTLSFLKEIQFDSVGVFSYSDRPMTESYKMQEKIPARILQKRVKQIKKQIPITD